MKKSVFGKFLLIFVLLFSILLVAEFCFAETYPTAFNPVVPTQYCKVDSDCGISTPFYICEGNKVMKITPIYKCEAGWFGWKMCKVSFSSVIEKTCADDEECIGAICIEKKLVPPQPPTACYLYIITDPIKYNKCINGQLPSLSLESSFLIPIIILTIIIILISFFVGYFFGKKKAKRR